MSENKFIPALGYDWLTGFYDFTIKITMPEKRFRTQLIDWLDPHDDERILEFGFGTGQNLLMAHGRNQKAEYTGLDVDPKVRDIAKRKLEQKQIHVALDLYEGKKFPYPDGAFDKVFSSLVFHQLDRESKLSALREIQRVLKRGGRLTIGDWGQAKSRKMRLAFLCVQMLDGFATTGDNVKGLLPQFIRDAGFVDVREAGFINTAMGTYSYYTASKR